MKFSEFINFSLYKELCKEAGFACFLIMLLKNEYFLILVTFAHAVGLRTLHCNDCDALHCLETPPRRRGGERRDEISNFSIEFCAASDLAIQ